MITVLLVVAGYVLVGLAVGTESYVRATRRGYRHGWYDVSDAAADRLGAWILAIFWPVALTCWPIRRYARWRATR